LSEKREKTLPVNRGGREGSKKRSLKGKGGFREKKHYRVDVTRSWRGEGKGKGETPLLSFSTKEGGKKVKEGNEERKKGKVIGRHQCSLEGKRKGRKCLNPHHEGEGGKEKRGGKKGGADLPFSGKCKGKERGKSERKKDKGKWADLSIASPRRSLEGEGGKYTINEPLPIRARKKRREKGSFLSRRKKKEKGG